MEGPGFDQGDEDFTGRNVTMVKDITYFVAEEFNTATYDSCKNVQFTGTGDTVMMLLCGSWGSQYCSAKRWWDYLGSVDNGYSPFAINYEYGAENTTESEDGHVYHNTDILTCDEVAPGYEVGCSCNDCPVACTAQPPDFRQKNAVADWEVAGINGVGFVMIFVFVGLTLLFLISICCCNVSLASNCRLNINTNAVIEKFFELWGRQVARYPLLVILVSVAVSLGLSAGSLKLDITTDPVELWAAPTSRSRIEKDFFDSEFRPFYRTSLVIFKAIDNPEFGMVDITHHDHVLDEDYVFTSMFNKMFLKKVLELQKRIENITFTFDETDAEGNVTTEVYDLTKVCNKPLNPFNANCNINSIWGYWNDNESFLDLEFESTQPINHTKNYLDHFLECSRNPTLTPQQDSNTEQIIGCVPKWGGVVNPYYVLGGFIPDGEAFPQNPQYQDSEAIVMQIIIDNYDTKSEDKADKDALRRAMAWELEFVNFMKNWTETELPELPYMDVAFTSERSVEDELERETYGDLATIAVSYIIMFVYITLALGQYTTVSLTGFLIESKITLGLFGVMIVILSVFASMGIFALVGVPATLIIFEIIPFLVLAVGVDNIFILVQTYQRDTRGRTETVEEQVGRVVGEVAPSMLQSSITESACFFLGALSGMPAVKSFALYAGMALLIDFLLQITAFIALMTLDIKRQEKRKFDILCCLGAGKKTKKTKEHVPVLYKVFEHFYAPALLSSYVRPAVMILFLGFTCLSISVVPRVEIGLDQELSMPEDSFVLKFFEWMKLYLSVGPPIYLVVNNTGGQLDLSRPEDQNLLCSGELGCREDGVAGQVNLWKQYPDQSYIATAAMSWMDDYLTWVATPGPENAKDVMHCCRFYENTTMFCNHDFATEPTCVDCFEHSDTEPRPEPELFQRTIDMFLNQNPGEHCPKAGHGAFADAVNHEVITGSLDTRLNMSLRYEVKSSNMMAFHTILRNSLDYYSALERARELTDSITASINTNRTAEQQVTVFPYSVFYVFYEQYLTMWEDTLFSLGISLGSIFVVTFLMMGLDLTSATIVLFTVLLILVNLGAFMFWWNITLNAVSLTNLVMAVGISVEFCAHIMKYFAKFAQEDRVENAKKAVINMGSSVLSGITLTKFGGIVVLAFANSQIFTIFFFRWAF